MSDNFERIKHIRSIEDNEDVGITPCGERFFVKIYKHNTSEELFWLLVDEAKIIVEDSKRKLVAWTRHYIEKVVYH